MRILLTTLSIAMATAMLGACSSAESKAARAQAEYTEEKTATLQEYKQCVSKAKGDEAKLKTCEALLKAVEATSGGE